MGDVKMSSFGRFYFDEILDCYRRLVWRGVGLRKSWQKAPSCRPEIMLGRAGLGVVGKNGEFQGKCQFGGVCLNLLEKNRNTGKIWVAGMGFQCEPGIYLSKIELGVGGGGPQNLDSVLSSDSDPNGRIRDEQET